MKTLIALALCLSLTGCAATTCTETCKPEKVCKMEKCKTDKDCKKESCCVQHK